MEAAESVHVTRFNQSVRALISRLERKSRSDTEIANLDRLRKRISLLKSAMGESALIHESCPFFIEYAERILEPDVNLREEFFLGLDIRTEYKRRKGVVKKQDEFIFSLTDSIRTHYTKAQRAERDEVYAEVKEMLTCCLEYAIANGTNNQ